MTNIFARGSGGGGGASGDKDTLFSGDAFEVVLGISEGPVGGIKGDTIADQLKNVFLDGTPILNNTSQKIFKESQIILSYERGTPVTEIEDPVYGQTPIPYILGGPASPVGVNAPLNYNVAVTRITPVTFRGAYNKVEIRILVSRLTEITDEGAKELSVRIKIDYKKSSSQVWKSETQTIKGKTVAGGFVRAYEYFLEDTRLDDYEFRVTMLDENDPDTTNRELMWLVYEVSDSMVKDGLARKDYHAGTAMVSLVAKVGENFFRLPNFTAVWRGLLCSIPSNYDPVTRLYNETSPWDGTYKVGKFFTNNPFWVAREIITNPRFGMAKHNPTVMLDEYSLYEEAKYADTLRTVITPEGAKQIPLFTFNGVITKQLLGLELINYILGSANAQAVEYSSGFLKVVSDRNVTPVMTVTPEMCLELHEGVSFTYNTTDLKDRFNEVTVSYIEPDMEWQPQIIGPFIDEEAVLIQGSNVYEFEAIGTTNRYEAEYKAYFQLIGAQTETLSVSFNIPAVAIAWDIFDIINIVDPNMDWGLSGRANKIVGDTIHLRKPMYFEDAGTYDLLLQTRQAKEIPFTFNIPFEGSYSELVLNRAVTEDIAKYPAFSITRNGVNPGQAKPFRVMSIKLVEGNHNVFAITAVEVNRNKWTQALNKQIGDGPKYSFELPRRPDNPANLRFLNSYVLPKDGKAQNIVALVWDAPVGSFLGLSYVVQASIDGGLMQDIGYTRLNQYDVEVEVGREYEFRIKQLYMETELYSDLLNYTVPVYAAEDYLEQNLEVNLAGEYRGEDLYYRIQAYYNFSSTSRNSVDLITSGKVAGVKVDFYDTYQGRELILSRVISADNDILLGSEQFTARGKLARTVAIEIRLIDFQGNFFPTQAIAASIEVSGLPTILNISAGASSRALSALPTLTNELPRNMTLKWFMGNDANGGDRIEIANTKAIHGYTVEPATTYYLWAQPTGPYGDGAMFPEGDGVLVQTTQDEALEGATSYTLTRSASLIKRQPDGSFSPPEVTLSAITQVGTGQITPYAGRFRVIKTSNGVDWVNHYDSVDNETDVTFAVPQDATILRVMLYQANGFLVKLDEENCQIIEDGVSYDLKIESTNGTIFRPGQSFTTMLKARVFKNGIEVTDEISESRFRWRRMSLYPKPYPDDDATWNTAYTSGYKQIMVTVDDVDAKATFHCDLMI